MFIIMKNYRRNFRENIPSDKRYSYPSTVDILDLCNKVVKLPR